MQFLRTVVIQDDTPAADGTVTEDLPVNPLSHVNLTIKCLNVTNEATIAHILALITNVEVIHRGTSIIQMSAADLYALNIALLGRTPLALNMVADDNGTRALGLIIPFGRTLFNPTECFPASKKGDLQIRLAVDIATAEADGLILQVEANEILAANPRRHLKACTLTSTPAATGAHDIDLPMGNPYAGILLYATTVVTGTAWTNTIEQVKLLANNTEHLFSLANWESLHADLINRCGDQPGHTTARGDDSIAHYSLMDMSPRNIDDFLLDTSHLTALTLRVTAGDTNAIRAIPLELPGS